MAKLGEVNVWHPERVFKKRSEGIEFLTHDQNGVDTGGLMTPGSRYGRTCAECAPVAWRLAYLIAGSFGEPITVTALDHAMSLVVNDHDDVAYIIRNYGGGKYR